MKVADLPNMPGVYKVKINDEMAYVGQSNDVKRRCQQHSVTNHPDAEIYVELFSKESKRRLREKELLREHRPPYNSDLPSKTSSNDSEEDNYSQNLNKIGQGYDSKNKFFLDIAREWTEAAWDSCEEGDMTKDQFFSSFESFRSRTLDVLKDSQKTRRGVRI